MVTVKELSELLNVSEDTVRRKIRKGDIPAQRYFANSGYEIDLFEYMEKLVNTNKIYQARVLDLYVQEMIYEMNESEEFPPSYVDTCLATLQLV